MSTKRVPPVFLGKTFTTVNFKKIILMCRKLNIFSVMLPGGHLLMMSNLRRSACAFNTQPPIRGDHGDQGLGQM